MLAAVCNESTLAASVVQGLAAVVDDSLTFPAAVVVVTPPTGIDAIPDMILWLKSDAGLYLDTAHTIAAGGGDSIGAWLDQSPSANHTTQGTNASQPSISFLTLNSRPLVVFSAFAKNWLNITSALSLGAANDYTIYYVGKTSIGNNTTWACLCSSTTNAIIGLYNTSGAKMQDSSGTSQTLTATYSASLPVAARARKSSSSYAWKQNGATEQTAFNPILSTFTLDAVGIGLSPGGTNYGGFIGEIIVYARALTTTEMATVETYLTGRWALTV